jgi:hypothetical protein
MLLARENLLVSATNLSVLTVFGNETKTWNGDLMNKFLVEQMWWKKKTIWGNLHSNDQKLRQLRRRRGSRHNDVQHSDIRHNLDTQQI